MNSAPRHPVSHARPHKPLRSVKPILRQPVPIGRERAMATHRRDAQQFSQWCADERVRILLQRNVFKQAGDAEALRLAMLERAWWLLDGGEPEAADALLEFVPAEHADRLLSEFFDTKNEFDADLYKASPSPSTGRAER